MQRHRPPCPPPQPQCPHPEQGRGAREAGGGPPSPLALQTTGNERKQDNQHVRESLCMHICVLRSHRTAQCPTQHARTGSIQNKASWVRSDPVNVRVLRARVPLCETPGSWEWVKRTQSRQRTQDSGPVWGRWLSRSQPQTQVT